MLKRERTGDICDRNPCRVVAQWKIYQREEFFCECVRLVERVVEV